MHLLSLVVGSFGEIESLLTSPPQEILILDASPAATQPFIVSIFLKQTGYNRP